jgi:two-component system, NarL family, response regulator NreC
MIKVVIVGNNDVMRCLTESYLTAQNDIDLSASVEMTDDLPQANNGNAPNVLVCNLLKPDTDSVRQVCRAAQENPRIGVVMIGGHCQETHLIDLLRAGVRSFIPLDVSPEELLHAVHEANQGRRYLPHPIYDRMIETILDKVPSRSRNADPALDPYDRLTAREHEVIRLAVEGHTCRDIGEQLCVSARTVETHRANAMHKLGLNSRIELLRYAVSRGILSVD